MLQIANLKIICTMKPSAGLNPHLPKQLFLIAVGI